MVSAFRILEFRIRFGERVLWRLVLERINCAGSITFGYVAEHGAEVGQMSTLIPFVAWKQRENVFASYRMCPSVSFRPPAFE